MRLHKFLMEVNVAWSHADADQFIDLVVAVVKESLRADLNRARRIRYNDDPDPEGGFKTAEERADLDKMTRRP